MVTGTGSPLAVVPVGTAAGTETGTAAGTVADTVAGAVLGDRPAVVDTADVVSGVVSSGADGTADPPMLPDVSARPVPGCQAAASSTTGVGAASVVETSPESRTSSPWGWEGTRTSLSPAGREVPTTEAWTASAPPVTNSPVPAVSRSSRPESAASLRYQGDQVPFSRTRR